MGSATTRLERALERHRDATLIEHRSGRHAAIRRDQVLADPQDTVTLDESLARWTRGREDQPGTARYHLRPEARVDIGELVSDLRDGENAAHRSLSPNHLVHGEPGFFLGPSGVPSPADPVLAPPRTAAQHSTTVAVLDTGLSEHTWFAGRDWYTAQRDDGIAEVLDADRDYELDSQAGHGTFIAGVVLQHAPAAQLLIRRVLGGDGICDEADLARALRDLRDYRDRSGRIDIVNLSLGCYTFDDRPTPVVERAVAGLARGTAPGESASPVTTPLVCCAGNGGSDRPFWPAALDDTIAVAALGARGEQRAAFSNYGEWVDACAVGEDVRSSFVNFDGPAPATVGGDPDLFTGFARWSGTSFAAPAVAGAIAARREEMGSSAAEAATELIDPSARTRISDLGAAVRP